MREDRQRLDKWLWFARFARTRSLAAQLATGGFVRVNGVRAENPAKGIGIGDVVTVAAPHATLAVRVLDLGMRRGPAPEARLLYDDLSDAAAAPEPRG
ncbi:RNA-binding S4 domain-containing protein [Methylobacterium sp. J-088]|uniref:RNA-binding S4 domain-containing protein n=1 Tax=Methylobacterium sp. J-088 TaxID=2836664 RepID=UPI001FBBD684|nr:RNA-binding S4 domain-containing protein [Methylobacterium sp. J-088]MCJ2064793.1 RNA-binding S4 domain-containing protein [Methylobacterium sp. J-088]